MEVVGVVGSIKHGGLDREVDGQIYWHYLQRTQDRAALVARASIDAASLVPSIVRQIRDLDPEQPVYDVGLMDDVVARSVASRWLSMALLAAFAAISVFLCCIGVYGAMAFGVARQRREFGIRLALGASRRSIAASVVTRGLAPAGIGIAAGMGMSIGVTRSMRSLLFGVNPADVISLAAGTLAILIVAILASYLPARCAAAVDPAVTLRAE